MRLCETFALDREKGVCCCTILRLSRSFSLCPKKAPICAASQRDIQMMRRAGRKVTHKKDEDTGKRFDLARHSLIIVKRQ
jgi:hypothetical protein